jgi:DNA polymerase-1
MKNNNKTKRLVLLDSHAILHRAYHALPDFASTDGVPTGALYGLSLMLIGIIHDFKPDYIVACFDLPKPTHRHEAYKEYKAGRAKTDENLIAQIKKSRDVFAAFGIPIYEKEGFEADDILGTIVENLKKDKGTDIVIASGDMDTMQLVSGKKVQVYTLKKGIKDTIVYDEDAMRERYGFGPELLPDYKGLRGDPSDNIIGIKGIGEKTATILIKEFGTIEEMYEKLKKEGFRCQVSGITPRILELLKNGEEEALFSKMLATIRRDAPIDFKLPEKTWGDNFDSSKTNALFAQLEFRTLGTRLKGVLSGTPVETVKVEKEEPKETLESLFSSGTLDKKDFEETAVALWLVNSSITNPTLEDILNFGKTTDFKKARETIFAELKKRNLEKVFNDIEKPLIPIITAMDEWGVKVDLEYLKDLGKNYHKTLDAIEKNIWKMAGKEFNVASPKQLGEVLFVDMGLKVARQKKTSTGAFSTKESELEKLREAHPIIEEIMKHREFSKLLGTYIDTIPAQVDGGGRLHAHFLQAGSTTGRMSSENPNLQNIPNKTELGRAIRRAFVADKGYKLLALDYSQIEIRIAAFLSKDEKLLEIFKTGQDVHSAVASQVFGVPQNEVTKTMRSQAKVINFGILYGMGVSALKTNLGTSREEAQKFYNDYFAKFTTLAQYLDRVKAEASRQGYVETFFGRRRYFDGINSKLPFIRAAAERMAINAPIQGTEADIVKIAMARIDEYLTKNGLKDKVHLLLQVHDELVYEVKESEVKKVAPVLKKIMEEVIDPKDIEGVACLAEAKAGDNWEEMEKIK